MDNKGKFSVTILLLGLIIAAAVTAWGVIIYRHLNSEDYPVATPVVTEDPGLVETPSPTPDDSLIETPPPTPDYIVTATPGIGTGSDEITIIDICEDYPEIAQALEGIADKINAASVSLTAYDSETGEYFTFSYGYADIGSKLAADIDTKYYMSSLSKLVTAVCVMSLVDDGYMDLDTDVTTYLGYRVRNPRYPDVPITARMLLQHTSSIFDSGAFRMSCELGSSESVKYLIERDSSYRRNKPGTTFEYSDFGYAVLGSLCERISGKSIDSFSREVIFEPLGIDAAFIPSMLEDSDSIAVLYDGNHDVSRSVHTQLAVEQSDTPGHDLHLAQSNLTISAFDYAGILAMLGNGGVFGESVILSSRSVNEIHKVSVHADGFEQGLATRYTSGNLTGSDGFYWHPGSAHGMFAQYIYDFNPGRGVVVVFTGAVSARSDSGMLDTCTEFFVTAWPLFEAHAEYKAGLEASQPQG